MRIYEVNIEHKTHGTNWTSVKIAADTADEAIRLAKINFKSYERLESVELLASTD